MKIRRNRIVTPQIKENGILIRFDRRSKQFENFYSSIDRNFDKSAKERYEDNFAEASKIR